MTTNTAPTFTPVTLTNKTTTDFGGTDAAARAVVAFANGQFLLAGYSRIIGYDFAVARYNANGTLDTSFGTAGKVTTDFGSNEDVAQAMATQADGKFIVAGYAVASNGYHDFALARYNANGTLDTSFGTGGKTTTDFGSYDDYAQAMATQADGKFIVAGSSYNGTDDFALARYNANGTLDTSFGKGGKTTTDFGSNEDVAQAMVTQADGKYIVAGYAVASNGYYDFALARYNANGTLDTSFGTNGKTTTAIGSRDDVANAMAIQADGKYVVAGYSLNAQGYGDFALARYNANGTLDTSFGTNGKTTTAFGSSDDVANAMAIQADGKFIVAGYSYNSSSSYDFALARYNANGTIDTSFGTGGKVTTDFGGDDYARAIAIQNGQYVVSGFSNVNGTTDFAVARYNADGTLATAPPTPTAGVNVVGTDVITNENGDTAAFSVSLKSAPVRDVTLNFVSSDTSEGVITTGASLKFTSTNWSVPQALVITGQNDTLNDGAIAYTINATVSTLDVIYKSITVGSLTITNSDIPPVPVETINGSDGIDVLQGTDAPSYILGKAGDDDISGGGGNDTLYGSYGNDVIDGQDGNDVLYGEQDADYLMGGNGNDTLDGGLGFDTLSGGAGNDTYYLSYDLPVDIIDDQGLPTDIDTVIMPYNLTKYTLANGIENATITAGTSASSLTGNISNNSLTGNDGANTLNGSIGRDSLFGGKGNDILIGGTGNDVLTGGVGKDNFRFDATVTTANSDTITDFKVIDDTIQLNQKIFTAFTAKGVIPVNTFVIGTAALDMNDYIIYNPNTGAVTYDSDAAGAGNGVQITLLAANLALTNADFVVV